MASFTDNPQALTNFNPYVAQLPVEAMVKVGMEKQKQYDEGIQKIQTNIDNIAGLDVAKDSDRAYLQSKINQLGNDTRIFAMSDFSNAQLVNSVNGMTNSIIKDNNVQNAVASTAKLRKEQQRKEKAIQDGKSSPENEYVFNLQTSAYINSSEVGESFNGQYIEYKDVDKKLRDLHSKLKEADYEVDDPWIRDAKTGKDIYFNPDGTQSLDGSKGGKRQYDQVMLTTKFKGIGAEKILNNFYDSLDETDIRQLGITAQYKYRDKDYKYYQNEIITSYDEKKKIYSDAIVDATVMLATKKLTAEQKTSLEKQILEAKALVYEGGFDKEMQQDLERIDTEGEEVGYKTKIYTQKYLTNLAKDLDNETKSVKYNDNPGFKAIMSVKQFEFDVAKERQREREKAADYAIDLRELALKEEDAATKRKEAKKLQPIVTDTLLETDFTKFSVEDEDLTLAQINQGLDTAKQKLARLLNPNFNAKDPRQVAEAMKAANDVYNEYLNNPNEIDDNTQRELLKEIQGLSNSKNFTSRRIVAAKEAGSGFADAAEKVINKQNGIRIGNTSYTAKELYDFQDETGKYIKQYTVRSGGGNEQRSQMTDDILKKYKGTKKYPIALALYKSYNNKPLSSNEQVITNQIGIINKNTSRDVSSLVKQQKEAESKTLYDLSPTVQGMKIQINSENKNDLSTIEQIIGLKTTQYNELGSLDSEKPDDFTIDKLNAFNESKSKGYTYIKNPDGGATLLLTGGGDNVKIKLSADEFNQWVPEYSYLNPMTPLIKFIQSSKAKTTNTNNTKDASTAQISGYNPLLPGINNSRIAPKVRADIEGSKNNTGNPLTDLFQVRIYYKATGKDWDDKVINSGGYINSMQAQELLSTIGPDTVIKLFK